MAKKISTLKGTTSSGFPYEWDPSILEDYELFELFAEWEENPLVIPKILRAILGEEQKKALLDHLRKDGGVAKVEDVANELAEILQASPTAKN